MIYIAHRALFEGPNPDRENHPDQIDEALKAGYDCEIDVRLVNDRWMLGHDEPTYEVDRSFLHKRGLWIHCKNFDALANIDNVRGYIGVKTPHYFWHQNDDFTITSQGFLWTYPGQIVCQRRGIRVQPEWDERWLDNINNIKGVGVCSKFVGLIRDFRLGWVI
jgi:hypothetical protein